MLRTEHEPEKSRFDAVPPALPWRSRLDSIDLLRGLVIVIMALDHVKHAFTNFVPDPTNVLTTTSAQFLTRWITHYCAPTFVFLAGTGAFLYGARGRTKGQLAWFLLSRGLWLVLLELVVIRFSWYLNFNYFLTVGQVIWAIGWSMVVLAGLVFCPLAAVTALGVLMIAFHNLGDGVRAADWGPLAWLWKILHTGEAIEVVPRHIFAPAYPLIPWIGVMAAGYGLGALMLLDRPERRRQLFGLGIVLTLAFIVLRYSNLYGDRAPNQGVSVTLIAGNIGMAGSTPANAPLAAALGPVTLPFTGLGGPGPWLVQENWRYTLFAFINTQKYPPSLLFLLMTLGPAIVALALFDRETGPLGRFFVIIGRVPLFFYLLHWFVIKGLQVCVAYLERGSLEWQPDVPDNTPPNQGYDLWVVYAIWLGVVFFLFPLCYWFAGVKRRSRAAWLSYL
jgi:uncharacterized membrane protein